MSISAINADAFVSEVLGTGVIWTIRDGGGFPTSTNASGETAMPFWSSEARAKKVIATAVAYQDFELITIQLADFIERWLPGLEGDGLFCGLNWAGAKVTGYDLKPQEVLARLNAKPS